MSRLVYFFTIGLLTAQSILFPTSLSAEDAFSKAASPAFLDQLKDSVNKARLKKRSKNLPPVGSFERKLGHNNKNPYLDPKIPSVSLLASIEDRQALLDQLAQLRKLQQKNKILINEIMIVGFQKQKSQEIEMSLKGQHSDYFPEGLRAKVTPIDPKTLSTKQKQKKPKKIKLNRSQMDVIAGLKSGDKRRFKEAYEKIFPPPFYQQLWQKQRLTTSGYGSAKKIIEHLGISYSPVWIVHFGGHNHIYEGKIELSSLFPYSRFRPLAAKFEAKDLLETPSVANMKTPLIKAPAAQSAVKFPSLSDDLEESIFRFK